MPSGSTPSRDRRPLVHRTTAATGWATTCPADWLDRARVFTSASRSVTRGTSRSRVRRPAAVHEFEPPALKLGAHVAALGMRFDGAMFPPEYRGRFHRRTARGTGARKSDTGSCLCDSTAVARCAGRSPRVGCAAKGGIRADRSTSSSCRTGAPSSATIAPARSTGSTANGVPLPLNTTGPLGSAVDSSGNRRPHRSRSRAATRQRSAPRSRPAAGS